LGKVKVKVKLSLCLTKHNAMKTYWGVEGLLQAFLASALVGGEWSASRPGRFTPRERASPPVAIGYKAGWAPEPAWWRRTFEEEFIIMYTLDTCFRA
jgi:hypothetical protein